MNTWIDGKDLMKHHRLIKKTFYSSPNIKEITDFDCRHAKEVLKYFHNNNLGGYHDLYDVFENFRNPCIDIYELDPGQFISAPGLA